ncbi:MAG TPA: hypothetical protein VFQ07_17480, partial [Candidatus Polarisedimenticolia bacterium]|nr:hypothetical protein [Candidatus Polarisedimenticolia bacterium]
FTPPAWAQSSTRVVSAGSGAFSGAPVYLGVKLETVTFGIGGDIHAAGGTADGDVSFSMKGVAVNGGAPREITLEMKIASGSVSASGVAVSGQGTVDPGDGSPVQTNIPFSLSVAPNSDQKGTLAMTVGGTGLNTAVVMSGGVISSGCQAPELAPSVRLADAQTLTWGKVPGQTTYNVYRGTIASPWVFNHTCFAPNLNVENATDATVPSVGQALYYFVAVKVLCGEGSLGTTTAGSQVPNNSPCP